MAGRKKRAPAIAPARDEPRRLRGRTREEAAFPASPPRSELPCDYAEALGAIKQRIREERLRVVLAANAGMVLLYWDIGRMILKRQHRAGWGAKVIDRLAADLREAFPDMKGFSPRNLKYMRAFAAAWPQRAIVQEALAQIPWYHGSSGILVGQPEESRPGSRRGPGMAVYQGSLASRTGPCIGEGEERLDEGLNAFDPLAFL